jgi:hypothetical protein
MEAVRDWKQRERLHGSSQRFRITHDHTTSSSTPPPMASG